MSLLEPVRVDKAKICARNGFTMVGKPVFFQVCLSAAQIATWLDSDSKLCMRAQWHPCGMLLPLMNTILLGANGPIFLFANISEISLAVRGMNIVWCQMHDSRWRKKNFGYCSWVTFKRIQILLILARDGSAEISNWEWCCQGSCI